MQPFASEIPAELTQADEALTRYGKWAQDRYRIKTCGSAEGKYRSPKDDLERAPRQSYPEDEIWAAQKALQSVSPDERTVLAILYIQTRIPQLAQLRIHKIPHRVAAERHLRGLRQFDLLFRAEMSKLKSPDTESALRMPFGRPPHFLEKP